MNRRRARLTAKALLLMAGVLGGAVNVAGDEMPLLTGEMWRQMSPENKVAFMWGAGHVVSFEHHVMQMEGLHTERWKHSSMIPHLVEGLNEVPMTEVIVAVDGYYESNPDDLQRPVIDAVFRTMIYPKMKPVE